MSKASFKVYVLGESEKAAKVVEGEYGFGSYAKAFHSPITATTVPGSAFRLKVPPCPLPAGLRECNTFLPEGIFRSIPNWR